MLVTYVHCSLCPLSLLFFRPGLPSIDVMATVTVKRSQIAKRRSNRIALNSPIELSGQDRQKCSFTMAASASNLNRHGATVQLNRELLVGSTVVVLNKRGTQVCARVVAQLSALQGVPTYGIEFIEQDERAKNFWGITFPSLESSATAQVAEQSGIARRRRGIPSHRSYGNGLNERTKG